MLPLDVLYDIIMHFYKINSSTIYIYGPEFCHKSIAAHNTIVTFKHYYSIVEDGGSNVVNFIRDHNTIVDLMNY